MQKKEKFTKKQKITFLVIFLIVFGLLYYFVGYRYFTTQIEKYSLASIEEQIETELGKTKEIEDMKKTIQESEGTVKGALSVYNNQSLEIVEMGRIFDEDADNVSLSWTDPVLSPDGIVRRNVSISFHCGSYQNFKNVLDKMDTMKYRCLIKNITAVDADKKNDTGLEHTTNINAKIEVTFFETIEGAESTAGLDTSNIDTDLSDSEMAKRAHAYDE